MNLWLTGIFITTLSQRCQSKKGGKSTMKQRYDCILNFNVTK